MGATDFDRIESLFHRAKALGRAERTAFLDEACAGDAALRSELDSLLAAHDEASRGEFLDKPATASFAESMNSSIIWWLSVCST